MTKLLYLHGLGSSGQASTAKGLAEQGFEVIAPDYHPEMCLASLAKLWQLVETKQPDVLVGTSMGGFYALKLAERFELPVVAVNACYEPAKLLEKYLTEPAMNFQTNEPIYFSEQMLAQFAPLKNECIAAPTIVIGEHDDVIPPSYQQAFCQQQQWQWLTTDWGHRVGDCAKLAEIIRAKVAMPA